MSDEPSDVMHAILDLHAALIRGFSRMQEQMDSRFERVEVRLTSIEGDVRGIRTWMARTDAKLAC